jgi:hypothetical protein
MSDQPEETEGEDEDWEPRTCSLAPGDAYIPDMDLLDEALARFGVVALGWRSREQDGEIECLLACEAGIKWVDVTSIGRRGNLRAV